MFKLTDNFSQAINDGRTLLDSVQSIEQKLTANAHRYIHEACLVTGWSLRELARQSGYSATLLSRVQRGKEKFTLKCFVAIGEALEKESANVKAND